MDFFLQPIGAGTLEELRIQLASSNLVRNLRGAKTGICFSKDSAELDWLGIQMFMLQYRRMDFPPGRGFWVSGGKARLVQTPRLGSCPQKN